MRELIIFLQATVIITMSNVFFVLGLSFLFSFFSKRTANNLLLIIPYFLFVEFLLVFVIGVLEKFMEE